jgi:UDPglucose 6-dehydrogenase
MDFDQPLGRSQESDQKQLTQMKRMAVVGLGYVGLSTAVCFSKSFEVVGIDVDSGKVDGLRRGAAPFRERGLSTRLNEGIRKGTLRCTDTFEELGEADIIFLTVGTPSTASGEIDLSQVRGASEAVGDALADRDGDVVVVVKSTVVPGTARRVVKKIIEEKSGKKCGLGFGLCSNPEFLREGSAIEDTVHPDRVVLGPFDERTGEKMRRFYADFYKEPMPPFVETTPEMAEMIKYASNAFLATKISFINMVARVCEKIPGGDVNEVAMGMGLDRRVGPEFLRAGPGFGGSCFPKDVSALAKFAEKKGVGAGLLGSTLRVNSTQPEHVLSMAEELLGGLEGRQVAVLGLAFNPNTDDVRESRAIVLAEKLTEKGAVVKAFDPLAMVRAEKELGSRVAYASNSRECVRGAELAILMTPWEEFKELGQDDYLRLMKKARLLDAARLYDPREFEDMEYAAVGLGRRP